MSNIPMPRPSYNKGDDRPVHEAGSDNTGLSGVDDIGFSPIDIDTSEKRSSSTPALQHNDTNPDADQTITEGREPVVYSTELDTSSDGNNAGASVRTGKSGSFETQLISSHEEEPHAPLIAVEERDEEISNDLDKSRDSEILQERNELVTSQLLEPALHTDLALKTPVSRTIHILGDNAVGKFFAHALAGAPKAPPITLLMHRPWVLKKWLDEGSAIRLLKGNRVDKQSGFNVELIEHLNAGYRMQAFRGVRKNRLYEPRDTIIDNLVVTTEGHTTISAIAAVRHRLQPSSTICFTQDSLGIINYINSEVFPDATERPNYMLASISHGVHQTRNEYSIVEHAVGRVVLTTIPRAAQEPQTKDGQVRIRRMDLCWQPSSRYLMRTFHRATDLCATSIKTRAFYKDQLENLAINSVLGPLSVIYNCYNSQLLSNEEVSRTIGLLAMEISAILRSLPEVSQIRSVDRIFSPERLENLVFSAIAKSGKNRTSMLLAVMQGKNTKIDFYNGYLIRRAKEFGINCPRLEMITSMVKGKEIMRKREYNSLIPFKRQH